MYKLAKNSMTWVVLLLFFATTYTTNAQSREVKPKRFVGLVHMTGSSDFVYYALSEKASTTLNVVGPGKLTVYNRVRLENGEKQSQPYYLRYLLDDKLIISEKIGPQQRSSKVKYKGKLTGTPSKADKFTITIPPGRHTLKFYKHKAKHKAHVRFAYERKEQVVWEERMPVNSLSSIGIKHIKTGQEQTYHRISATKGFVFKAKEATRLRVYLRSDFNYKMHAENVVRLVLKKDGRPVATYKVTCRKSSKVEYTNDNRSIPGALEKIYVNLPDSKAQSYELVLKGGADASAIIRVSTNLPDTRIANRSF